MLPTIVRKRNYSAPSFLDELFNNHYLPGFTNEPARSKMCSPAVNVQEAEKEFRIEVSAPGINKDELKVSVEEGVLNISYEAKDEQKEKQEEYLRREFHSSSFSRSFNLPEDVETDSIRAEHKNGVLSIKLPKTEVKVSPAKEIKIA